MLNAHGRVQSEPGVRTPLLWEITSAILFPLDYALFSFPIVHGINNWDPALGPIVYAMENWETLKKDPPQLKK